MNTFTVTATELKNKTAEIMNQVYYGNAVCLITKSGKPILSLCKLEVKTTKTSAKKPTKKKSNR